MRASSVLLTVLASLLPAMAMVSPADAATFTVTRTDDPTPDGCLPADCSLREAVLAANGAEGSTITVPAGEYTLSIPGTDDDSYDERIGDLDIRVAMTIKGAGASSTIVQQTAGLDRIFDNRSSTPVTIADMTVRNGGGNPRGGGIRNTGKLTVDSVTVTGCTSLEMGGGVAGVAAGGFDVLADLLVIRSTITGNSVQGSSTAFGGGVGGDAPYWASGSSIRIIESEISNNTAPSGGGVGSKAFFIVKGASSSGMTISNTRIVGNTALEGGAAYFSGQTARSVISHSTVRDNRARYGAGGIKNEGTTYIDHSVFAGNLAGVGCVAAECDVSFAGGILNSLYLEVTNSTFSGNACGPGQVQGGAIMNAGPIGTLSSANSTFTANTCALGAGVATQNAHAVLKNTIMANNAASDPSGGDCAGAITSQGYNLIGNVTGCTFTPATGDLIGSDPQLGPLQDNGGPTATHALSASSPARNAGDPAGCTGEREGEVLQSDQRGYARPQEGRCDIGAFEYGIDALVVYRLRHPAIGAYLFTLYTSERDSAQSQYGYVYEGICCSWLAAAGENRAPLYRLFSSTAGEYFFTISPAERDGAVSQFGYVFEGTAAYCHPDPAADRTAWFRLRYGNKHFYTIYPEERDAAVANLGYVYEGVACFLPVP